jgi:hypothetical protein
LFGGITGEHFGINGYLANFGKKCTLTAETEAYISSEIMQAYKCGGWVSYAQ